MALPQTLSGDISHRTPKGRPYKMPPHIYSIGAGARISSAPNL